MFFVCFLKRMTLYIPDLSLFWTHSRSDKNLLFNSSIRFSTKNVQNVYFLFFLDVFCGWSCCSRLRLRLEIGISTEQPSSPSTVPTLATTLATIWFSDEPWLRLPLHAIISIGAFSLPESLASCVIFHNLYYFPILERSLQFKLNRQIEEKNNMKYYWRLLTSASMLSAKCFIYGLIVYW